MLVPASHRLFLTERRRFRHACFLSRLLQAPLGMLLKKRKDFAPARSKIHHVGSFGLLSLA